MKKSVFALGFFDAFHKGHLEIIREGKRLAALHGAELCLVTFDDNIYKALDMCDKELYLLRERRETAFQLGVSDVLAISANKKFMDMSAEGFLNYLEEMNPIALVAGEDYRFGKGASGDCRILKDYFTGKGVQVSVCDLLKIGEVKISTTLIKRLLSEGRIKEANEFLLQPYFMSGVVVNGLKNGRKIGLPTANIDFDENKFVPKTGVYMTKATVEGKKYLSVSNVGTHPTVGSAAANLETHILDFVGDLYGKEIKIEFLNYIREIKRFDDLESLRRQIGEDIERTRKEYLL